MSEQSGLNSDLSIKSIILILSIFGSLLGAWAILNDHALRYSGPTHLHLDPSGRMYVQVDNQLFRYQANGEFDRQFDLSDIGIESLAGDFAFFSDNDLLLSQQKYQPTLIEKIKIYLRIKNVSPQNQLDRSISLMRCYPDAKKLSCSPFSSQPPNLNQAFHLFIDTETDDIYLAEPDRHLIRKFNSYGEELARKETGLRFPNQITIYDKQLYIANTNYHQILIINKQDENFGATLKTINTENYPADLPRQERWPSTFLKTEGYLWVNNAQHNMTNGGIYLFNEDKFIKRLALPENSDPFQITRFNNKVLISDISQFKIYQFNLEGKKLDDFKSPELEDYLNREKSSFDHYTTLSKGALYLFWAAVVIGIGIAIKQTLTVASDKFNTETTYIDVSNPDIHWIAPSPKTKRQLWLLIIALTGMPLLLLAFSFTLDNNLPRQLQHMALALLFASFLLAYTIYHFSRVKLGILNETLILKKGKVNYAAATGSNILYSDTAIFIGDLFSPLRSGALQVYSSKDMIDYIYPRLKNATELDQQESTVYLLKQIGVRKLFILALALLGSGFLIWLTINDLKI